LARTIRVAILCMAVAMSSTSLLEAMQPSADDTAAIAHAKRLFQLLREDKVEDVAKEFTSQMTAALTPAQMRSVLEGVRGQAGTFQSFIDERVTRPSPGFTAVMLGCQYDNNGVNAMFVFDAENKLAGLRFNPMP